MYLSAERLEDFLLLEPSTLPPVPKGVSCKTEWGTVLPSKDLQCFSATRTHFGDDYEILIGLSAHRSPHHERELALGRALTGDSPGRLWLHVEPVLVDGKGVTGDGAASAALDCVFRRM